MNIIIPEGCFESEFSEKKSRFISYLRPVECESDVKGLVKEIRAEHPASRHVVWASVLGDGGTIHGLSDDGEPHGTAGRPVLEVLKGSGVTYALIMVVRYFGGIKLGTGGLVSAYTRAAQDVLAVTDFTEKVNRIPVHVTCSYSQYEGIKKILEEHNIIDCREDFTDNVKLQAMLPEDFLEECCTQIRNYTHGIVEVLKVD